MSCWPPTFPPSSSSVSATPPPTSRLSTSRPPSPWTWPWCWSPPHFSSGGSILVWFIFHSVFSSVMEKLPPTSYVRLVDIWLINGQLVPFIEVILLTVLELKREGTSAINHHGFKRLPKIIPNFIMILFPETSVRVSLRKLLLRLVKLRSWWDVWRLLSK